MSALYILWLTFVVWFNFTVALVCIVQAFDAGYRQNSSYVWFFGLAALASANIMGGCLNAHTLTSGLGWFS